MPIGRLARAQLLAACNCPRTAFPASPGLPSCQRGPPYHRRVDLDDPGMIWEPLWVGRPKGTHLAADGTSPLAFSDKTRLLETQVVLGPSVGNDDEDDDEDEESSDTLKWIVGIGIAVVATVAATKAAPVVIKWRKARRATKEKTSVTARATVEAAFDTEGKSTAAMDNSAFASEVDSALDKHRRSMSSAEAQRRVLAILVAAAFIADQMRELSGVRIDDDVPELQAAMDKLSAAELTASLNRMLEADSSALDHETSAELLRAFGGGSVVEGDFVPLSNDKVKAALRLRQAA